jgi:hypothetical protein
VVRVAVVAGLLTAGGVLEATGKLRQWVIAAFGKVPGGYTRLQTHQLAIAHAERSARGWLGPAQPAGFFVGTWHRADRMFTHDIRKFTVRRDGERLLVRAWTLCDERWRLCREREVAAVLERAPGGGIQALNASFPTGAGQAWLKLAPSRDAGQGAFVMTHVALERDAAWQVSSGGAVMATRERAPVPVASFVGAWRRVTAPQLGDFTRLRLRSPDGASLIVQLWMLCGEGRECDLGEKPAETDGEGGVSRAVAGYGYEHRQLGVTLEPRADGDLDATSDVATLRYTTRTGRRGGTYTDTTGRASRTLRTVLRRGE